VLQAAKGVGGRRGSSRARWSEARRSGVEENRRGGGGGPVASQAAGGKRLSTWSGGKIGARVAARGVREGGGSSSKTWGRRVQAVAGERRRARWGGGRRRGKRGRERYGQVGPTAI
jgi:hypothetical protein